MEPTFYDDSHFSRGAKEDIRTLKRNMTLDLDSPRMTKKAKYTSLLTSPDLNMLKLASPELERLIIAQNGLVTTTPTPTQFLFARSATEEQEQYAKGFVDALAQLHQGSTDQGTSQSTSDVLSSDSGASTSSDSFILPSNGPASSVASTTFSSVLPTSSGHSFHSSDYLPSIKDEPQTVPSLGVTPPLSPIDMRDQERIKLERKRLRNRIAASKCRRRKLERIARLEDKVHQLKTENNELTNVVTSLRDQVCQLKQEVMEHVKSGCQIMHAYSMA